MSATSVYTSLFVQKHSGHEAARCLGPGGFIYKEMKKGSGKLYCYLDALGCEMKKHCVLMQHSTEERWRNKVI